MTGPAILDTTPSERLSRQHLRATALIALAVLVIASASAAYLHSTKTTQPPTQPPTQASALAISPLQVTSNAVDFDFVTPSMGWASLIVERPSSGAGQFQVFRTIDGAKHWQQQLAGQSSFPGFSPITVQFFGKTHGFLAVGGPVEQLYRTDDGGAHWNPLVLPLPRVDGITFSDTMHGWMLGYPSFGLPGLSNLYATSDAGQTWQRLPDPPADAAGLSIRRPTEVWMGGVGPGPPHVYTSSDVGQSWQRHDLPAPPRGLWDPTFAYQVLVDLLPGAGVVAWAYCAQIGCLAPGPFYFRSSDGGITWRHFPSPPGILAYQDSVHWWAMSATAMFKSSDSGQSWRRVATLPLGLQFTIPRILDSMHAWSSLFVAGGYGLAVTNDGGIHWTLVNVPQSD